MKVALLIGTDYYTGASKGDVVVYRSITQANQMAWELNHYHENKAARDDMLKFVSQEEEFRCLPKHDKYFVEVVEIIE